MMYLWAVLLIIYGSMFFIGVPANGILIWVYYKISKKRRMEPKSALKGFTSTDLLLLGLALIDFLACLAAIEYWQFNTTGCVSSPFSCVV